MSTRRTSLRDKPSIFQGGYAAGEGKKARKEESKTPEPKAAGSGSSSRPPSPAPRWRKANWLVREDRLYDLKLLAAKRRTSLYKLLEEALANYLDTQKRAS